MISSRVTLPILLAVAFANPAWALPVHQASATRDYPDRLEDIFRLPTCKLLKTMDIAGYDFFGNPVHGAVCMGSCPRQEQAEECLWGCAPSDYSVCPCAPAGRAACEAFEDQTGDLVCGWDSALNTCQGCNGFSTAADCNTQPNCDWNGAGSGVCMARGSTTSPTCDGRGNPCAGHSEADCEGEAGSSDQTKTCQASSYKIALKFRFDGGSVTIRTTSEPKTLITRSNDFDITADWLEPLPGLRHARGVADADKEARWINGITCDGDMCSPMYSKEKTSGNAVTEAYCTQMMGEISGRDEADVVAMMTADARVRHCVTDWASKRWVRILRVPTSCDCQ